jgi:hypothetical protein
MSISPGQSQRFKTNLNCAPGGPRGRFAKINPGRKQTASVARVKKLDFEKIIDKEVFAVCAE